MGKRPAHWSAALTELLSTVGTRGSRDFVQRNSRYVEWRLRHPLRSFTDFYVAEESKRLDAGMVHPSLGRNRVLFDGYPMVQLLIKAGLQADHRLVDYGCGSLRLGRELIAYLAPDRYWGLDVTARFFRDGLQDCPPDLIREKRPRLALISRRVLRELAASPPDFVIVSGVFHHIPLRQTAQVMRNLARISGQHTKVYIGFLASDVFEQVGPYSFRHPPSLLLDLARRAGLGGELLRLTDQEDLAKPIRTGLMRLERLSAPLG